MPTSPLPITLEVGFREVVRGLVSPTPFMESCDVYMSVFFSIRRACVQACMSQNSFFFSLYVTLFCLKLSAKNQTVRHPCCHRCTFLDPCCQVVLTKRRFVGNWIFLVLAIFWFCQNFNFQIYKNSRFRVFHFKFC